MVTRVIAPKPTATRKGAPKAVPVAPPRLAPRGAPERHRLTPMVRAPGVPTPRRRRAAPPPTAPAPVLRLVVPKPEPIQRFTLARAPVAARPRAAPAVTGEAATSVGITGTGGTHVSMVPADLTQAGRVDITEFRVSLFAGVW